ncbi:MAG: ABC transporter ATP-binding protein [Myxococcales bacterium]|nr:ABC transporter ATP-binding protein [Myxococcales bacterium]MCB9673146.1 ABC transporter ATP-binding protein [Alphaproteobacteria bacterium]MCB9691895.1 ABC transporter ATP-binding protein [Alphaproteobacteria bacterium]
MPAPLLRLLTYADAHRSRIVAASAFSVLNKLFDLAPPLLIGLAVDTVVEKRTSWLGRLGVEDVGDQLVVIAVLTVVVWALESVFEYAFEWMWRNLAQTLQHDLRMDAYRHVQQLDQAWFHERSTGGLMAVLNDDVNQLERFLDGGANSLIQIGTTMVAVSVAFFWVSPTVAALAMLPIPVILAGSFAFQARIGPRYAEVRARAADVNGQLANNLSGIATIQSFTAETAEAARLEGLSDAYRSANRGAIALSAAFSPLIRMAIVVGFTATLVVGGHQALAGTIEVGAYSTLVFLTQRLLWPLTGLGQTVDLYQRAMASTARILDLLDTPVTLKSGGTALPEVRGDVRFEDVGFAYPGREQTLDSVTLEVPAGQTVAIVGPTGSGKSTLIRLLLRFYDTTSGRVTLDGHDVRDLDLRDLRGAVGLVSQSTFLFAGTVAENVRLGKPGATLQELEAAAEAAEALAFVRALPQGWDTPIGERGVKLSGGQQQRLALARAVLKNPPVLVLDEATSAVDNETEAAIQRSLERLAVGRTVLVIAHRLSTVRNAHHIVVVEDGRIVERGTHEDLAAAGGPYARLWRIQTGAR